MLWKTCFLQSLIFLFSCSSMRPPYTSWLLNLYPYLLIRKAFKMERGKRDVKATCTCWWVKARPLLHLVLLLQYRKWRARTWCRSSAISWCPGKENFSTDHRDCRDNSSICLFCCVFPERTFICIPQSLSSQKRNISSQLLLPFFQASVPRKSSRAI